MANSRLQNSVYESLTRKNAVIVSPPDGVRVEDVVTGLGELVGFENVLAASKMNQRVVVFLSEERYVAQAVETGLSLPPDIFVNVSMLDSPAVKITLSNLPPFVKNEQILSVLKQFGTVVSKISMIPFRLRSDSTVRHIMSFRRHCYMVLKNNAQSLNASATLVVENRNYQMYIATETMTCFTCGAFGHLKGACPKYISGGTSRQSGTNADPSGTSRVDISNNNGASTTADRPSRSSAEIDNSPADDAGFITVSSKRSFKRGSGSEDTQASCSKKIAPSNVRNVSNLETEAPAAGLLLQNRFSVFAETEGDVSVHSSHEQGLSATPQDVVVTTPVTTPVTETKTKNHKPALVTRPADDELFEVMEEEEVTAPEGECEASDIKRLIPVTVFKTPAVETATPLAEADIPVVRASTSVCEEKNKNHSDYDSDGASSLASSTSSEVWNDPAIAKELEGDDDLSPMEILRFLQDTFRKKNVKIIITFFPNLSGFITSSRRLLLKAEQLGVTESQVFRLRKCVLKARKELQAQPNFPLPDKPSLPTL